MEKDKESSFAWVRRLVLNLFTGANLVTLFLLWACCASTWINPALHPRVSVIGMLFPIFLILNLLFLVLWLVYKPRMIVVPIVGDEVCAGLDGFAPGDADTIVIAGMGGETIIAILNAAPWLRKGNAALLLQPMTKAELLRPWLVANGWRIDAERLVRDRGTIYAVLSVSPGEGKTPDASPGRSIPSGEPRPKRSPTSSYFFTPTSWLVS